LTKFKVRLSLAEIKTNHMIKKLFLLCAFGLTILISKAQVVPNVDWIQNFNDRNNISNAPFAIDANQSVYSTGYVDNGTDFDLYCIKYDSLGVLQWSVTVNNGGTDIGKTIAIDASGNTYVAGVSYVSGSNDYVTLKIGPTGTIIWTKYYGSATQNDEGTSIKVDNSGNVFTTGTAHNGTNLDIVTLKYSPTGTLLNTHTFNGVANGNDYGVSSVLSSDNTQLFVTGNTTNSLSVTEIVTIRMQTSNFATIWSAQKIGTGGGNNGSSKIILSGSNVVICGYVNNTTTNDDYLLAKYAISTGSLLFSQTYDFGNNYNLATDLVRDSLANIVVTGLAVNSSTYEYHTLLFDSLGNNLWINVESTGLVSAIINPRVARDTIANHFYIAGAKMSSNTDVFVYQITPSGNTTWTKKINGVGNGSDAATGIAVNGIGVVYLGALTDNGGGGYDITTIKISQTPLYYPVDTLNEAPNIIYSYTKNKGQLIQPNGTPVTDADVQFYTEKTRPNFFFKDNSMSFIYTRYDSLPATEDSLHKVNIDFYRSNPLSEIYNGEPTEGSKNYFMAPLGGGVTGVKNYKRIAIPNIYPGIDLHYYSNAAGLKYYFVVKPGANASQIIHQFTGASSTTISATNLLVSTTLGTLSLQQAYPYQVAYSGGTYSIVPVNFTANWVNVGTNMYAFNTGTYNPALPLVFEVDQGNISLPAPANNFNMNWNTYVGANKTDNFKDMEIDALGNVYALMNTNSQVFYTVTTGSFGAPFNFVDGAVIWKFTKHGQRRAEVYVGSSGGLIPWGMTVTRDSNVVLVGTSSSTIPVISFTNPAGSYTNSTGGSFIFKLSDSTLKTVKWSTRYPGLAMDVDRNGNNDIYLLANAAKTGTDAAYLLNKNNALNLGTGNITYSVANVISRFDSTGVPNWSSFIPLNTKIAGIKVDRKRNNFYVVGQLNDTTDFKHFNHYNTFLKNVKSSTKDAVIQKYTAADTIKVSTLYGGDQDDVLTDLAVLSNGQVCIVGQTSSSDYSNISYNPNDGSYFNVSGSGGGYNTGWIHKFDSTMTRKWSITYGDSLGYTGCRSVTRRNDDWIFIGGVSNKMQTLVYAGSYNQTSTVGVSAFWAFDETNKRTWVSFMGSPYQPDGGVFALKYNQVNNNLYFAGSSAASSNGYPFQNFTGPQAYWQPLNASGSNSDGLIGRFNTTLIVGIKEYENTKKENILLLFPNPAAETVSFIVGQDLTKPYIVRIYNSVGQVVYHEIVAQVSNPHHTVDLRALSKGVYFVNIFSPEINKTGKLIKD